MSGSKIEDDINNQTCSVIYINRILNFHEQIKLIIRISVCYHIPGKVTVNLTITPILASGPRGLRICPRQRLRTTLIIRHKW